MSRKNECAIEVFDDLAAGRVPNRLAASSAALRMEPQVVFDMDKNVDLQDMFVCLRHLAIGESFELDAAGRARAARFASLLRAEK